MNQSKAVKSYKQQCEEMCKHEADIVSKRFKAANISNYKVYLQLCDEFEIPTNVRKELVYFEKDLTSNEIEQTLAKLKKKQGQCTSIKPVKNKWNDTKTHAYGICLLPKCMKQCEETGRLLSVQYKQTIINTIERLKQNKPESISKINQLFHQIIIDLVKFKCCLALFSKATFKGGKSASSNIDLVPKGCFKHKNHFRKELNVWFPNESPDAKDAWIEILNKNITELIKERTNINDSIFGDDSEPESEPDDPDKLDPNEHSDVDDADEPDGVDDVNEIDDIDDNDDNDDIDDSDDDEPVERGYRYETRDDLIRRRIMREYEREYDRENEELKSQITKLKSENEKLKKSKIDIKTLKKLDLQNKEKLRQLEIDTENTIKALEFENKYLKKIRSENENKINKMETENKELTLKFQILTLKFQQLQLQHQSQLPRLPPTPQPPQPLQPQNPPYQSIQPSYQTYKQYQSNQPNQQIQSSYQFQPNQTRNQICTQQTCPECGPWTHSPSMVDNSNIGQYSQQQQPPRTTRNVSNYNFPQPPTNSNNSNNFNTNYVNNVNNFNNINELSSKCNNSGNNMNNSRKRAYPEFMYSGNNFGRPNIITTDEPLKKKPKTMQFSQNNSVNHRINQLFDNVDNLNFPNVGDNVVTTNNYNQSTNSINSINTNNNNPTNNFDQIDFLCTNNNNIGMNIEENMNWTNQINHFDQDIGSDILMGNTPMPDLSHLSSLPITQENNQTNECNGPVSIQNDRFPLNESNSFKEFNMLQGFERSVESIQSIEDINNIPNIHCLQPKYNKN